MTANLAANWFATFALVSWPLVALLLYQTRPLNQAILWTILGGQLLLPVGVGIKFEGIPEFDKVSIPNLVALIGCVIVARRPPRLWYRFGLPEVLLLVMLIGRFATSEFNTDPLVYQAIVLPPETHYDAFSAVVAQFIFLIPFFLGRQLLRNSVDNEEILRVLVVAGLIYSLPMLFEVRMSPQLHNWIYGYHPHSFAQQARDGGFRPVVFLGHGLVVAFFAMTTAVAAAALWRTRLRVLQMPPVATTAYLSVVFLLCKSVASIVYGAVLIPLVRFAKPLLQVRVAMILATLAFTYPLLRTADLVPTEMMLDAAKSVSEERAESLKTRLDQEQKLLEHASSRALFGWGRFGRNRSYDNETGKDNAITDGRWIITLGVYGFFGFVAEFGLLALAVFRAASALRFTKPASDRNYLAALALIVAVNMVDLLPNSTLSPWTWLLAGALLGRAEALRSSRWLPSSANSKSFEQRILRERKKLVQTRGAQ